MVYPLTPGRFQVSIGVQCRPFGLVGSHSGGEEDGFEQVDTHHWPPWTVKAGSAATSSLSDLTVLRNLRPKASTHTTYNFMYGLKFETVFQLEPVFPLSPTGC
jgi:hypothetical protein